MKMVYDKPGIKWIKLTRKIFPKISLVIVVSVWNHLSSLNEYHPLEIKSESKGGKV